MPISFFFTVSNRQTEVNSYECSSLLKPNQYATHSMQINHFLFNNFAGYMAENILVLTACISS